MRWHADQRLDPAKYKAVDSVRIECDKFDEDGAPHSWVALGVIATPSAKGTT